MKAINIIVNLMVSPVQPGAEVEIKPGVSIEEALAQAAM